LVKAEDIERINPILWVGRMAWLVDHSIVESFIG
jgi:hypothetical protein